MLEKVHPNAIMPKEVHPNIKVPAESRQIHNRPPQALWLHHNHRCVIDWPQGKIEQGKIEQMKRTKTLPRKGETQREKPEANATCIHVADKKVGWFLGEYRAPRGLF